MTTVNMLAMTENFKGIEFVRISSLPEDQKEKIWNSLQQDKIIKIVKDQTIMSDCVLYSDYITWLNQTALQTAKSHSSAASTEKVFLKRLAFK